MTVFVRSPKATLVALTVALLALLLGAARSEAADPAIFEAGAGKASINPDTPQYIGGYGYKGGPTMDVNDPLEARAFMVGAGKNAAVMVSADLTGWFAAYDGANLEPYGIDRTREKIADAMNARGYQITRESVIISSTHTHSAPAVVGIWGPVDAAYLKKVSEAAVTAAIQAADSAKPSEIWAATGNVRSFVWQNGQGTNHPDGFDYDNNLPIMWARDPETGATNALYANVPNHPDQFRGEAHNKLSADWVGYARTKLDGLNGGTAVIAPGTLGRQEPPGSVNTYDEVIPQGEFVANEIQRTMAKATPLTSNKIAASEQHLVFEGDNAGLINLIRGYFPPDGSCLDGVEYCTIPRSKAPAYFTDKGTLADVGTYTSMVQIGDLLYATNPGEAFAEVNTAIRDSISGARSVNAVGMTDMLGYYYVRGDYTPQQFGSSNFETYNVGPDLAQMNADLARENAKKLGFQTTNKVVHAVFNADVKDRAGLQWYPDQLESADPVINILGSTAKSQDNSVPAPAQINWDFDDGTTSTTSNQDRFDHTFPGPGTYEVKATVTGSNSKTRTWNETITINPPLAASATQTARAWDGASLSVTSSGGSGELVSAKWTCQDGSTVYGLNVTCAAKGAGTAQVTAVDGAGNQASTSVAVSVAPAKLKLGKVKPKKLTMRKGKKKQVRVTVQNVGGSVAKKVKVCVVKPSAKRPVKVKCPGTFNLAAGKSRTVKLTVRGKKAGKSKLSVVATRGKADKSTAPLNVKVKR